MALSAAFPFTSSSSASLHLVPTPRFQSPSSTVQNALAFAPKWFQFAQRYGPLRATGKPQIAASFGTWREIIDPASGKPYYWNTETNETTWQRPTGWRIKETTTADPKEDTAKLPLDELAKILLGAVAADTSRFGDVANQYRPQCFEDEFFEHLTDVISTTEDKVQRERFEKLRARLANPLLKNPPPY